MPIEFACSSCSKQVRVPDGSEGKKCKCPECQTILNVPKAETEAIEIKLEVPCPRCDFVLVCDPSLEGTRGLCPNCKLIFTIEPQGASEKAVQESDLQMSFAFQCPHCKQLFEGKPGMEGRNGKCIHCKKVFEIKKFIDPAAHAAPKPKKISTKASSAPQLAKPTLDTNPTKPVSWQPTARAASTPPATAPSPNEDWLGSLSVPAAKANPNSVSMNPYAVSVTAANDGAQSSEGLSGDAASIRNFHLAHESAIKGFGLLYAIGAGFYILFAVAAAIFSVFAFAALNEDVGQAIGVVTLIYAAVSLAVGVLVALVSYGLYKLSDVGKIGGAIFSVLSLCGIPIGTLLGAYMLYLLFSEKGNFIFTQRYRSIVKQTPHIRCRVPVFVWIILACSGLLLVLAVLLAVVGLFGRW